MTAFWVPALLVTVFALGFLLIPLLRQAAVQAARAEYDVTVYRDQLTEVDRDLDRGVLTADEAGSARTEIKRRMLAAAEDANMDATSASGSRRLNIAAMAVIAVLVPAGALAMYAGLGSPDLRDHPLASRPKVDPAQQQAAAEAAKQQAEARKQFEGMVATLEQRLEEEPDSLDGWMLLARSYGTLERFADSAGAYNQALRLSDRRPDILGAYGEVLVLAQKGQVSPIAATVFREVLQKDAADPRAQFYLGLAEAQAGNLRGAYDAWVILYEGSPAGAPWLPEIRARVLQAAKELDIEDDVPVAIQNPPAPPSAPMLAQPGPVAPGAGASVAPGAPGPTQEQVRDAADMSDQDRTAMIRSMVERLAGRLAENPDDRDGWLRLARAYEVLGEAAKAEDAKKRAAALGGN